MTCSNCSKRIEKHLLVHDPPISNIRVDFMTNKVLFSIDSSIGPDPVLETLKNLGYAAKKVTDIT